MYTIDTLEFVETLKKEPKTIYVYKSEEDNKVYIVAKNPNDELEEKYLTLLKDFKKQHPQANIDLVIYGDNEISSCFFPMDGTIFS